MLLNETPVSDEGHDDRRLPRGEVQSVSADGTSNRIRLVGGRSRRPRRSSQAYLANNLSTPLYTEHPGRAAGSAWRLDQVFRADDRQRARRLPRRLNEVDACGNPPATGQQHVPSLSGNAGVSRQARGFAAVLAPEGGGFSANAPPLIRSGRDEKVASGVNEGLSPAR